MTRASAIVGVVVVVALVVALPSVAAAHPEVERLRRAVMEGDYEAARPGLDAALERDDLRLADLVAVFELRAMLFHGLLDEAALDGALRALIAIDPGHTFGSRYPPNLAQRSVALRDQVGGLHVMARSVPSAVGVRLEAEVVHDSEHLVRRLRFRVFDAERGQWAPAEPPIEAAAGREVLVLVEAVGPGGAVVARAGTSDEPIRVAGPSGVASADVASPVLSDGSGASVGSDDWVPWVVVAVVAAVLGGIGLGLGVYLSDNPTITWQPTSPMETR